MLEQQLDGVALFFRSRPFDLDEHGSPKFGLLGDVVGDGDPGVRRCRGTAWVGRVLAIELCPRTELRRRRRRHPRVGAFQLPGEPRPNQMGVNGRTGRLRRAAVRAPPPRPTRADWEVRRPAGLSRVQSNGEPGLRTLVPSRVRRQAYRRVGRNRRAESTRGLSWSQRGHRRLRTAADGPYGVPFGHSASPI